MWILVILLIELTRFCFTLSQLRSSGLFIGWLGLVLFALVDWFVFFIALPALWHYLPVMRLRPGVWLGEWLRRRINLHFDGVQYDPLAEASSVVFACHGHGVLATAQLLLFMLRPKTCPELANYTKHALPTVSSQLLAMPLTNFVCRVLLGAESIADFARLIRKRHTLAISPGGAKEITLNQFDTDTDLHIFRRAGFLRLCYENNMAIMPLLTLGNHTMFRMPPMLRWIQWFNFKLIGYGMPLPAFGEHGTLIPLKSSRVKIISPGLFRKQLTDSETGIWETLDEYILRYYSELSQAAHAHGVRLHFVTEEQALARLAQ